MKSPETTEARKNGGAARGHHCANGQILGKTQ